MTAAFQDTVRFRAVPDFIDESFGLVPKSHICQADVGHRPEKSRSLTVIEAA